MFRLLRAAAPVAALALALTACGGTDTANTDKTKTTTNSTTAAATGKSFSTADFSYKAPKGWTAPNQKVPSVVSLAVNQNDKDGFADNVNVVKVEPASVTQIDKFEAAFVKELEGSNATKIKVHPRQDLDGETAAHVTSGANQNGTKYVVNQFGVVHNKANFVITFSFSPDVPLAKQESVSQAVMATWRWKS